MKPIIFDNVSKVYRLRGRKPTLSEIIGNLSHALRGNGKPRPAQIFALRDVSFEVERGEVLGIIGPNGAGKTTILSLIAGVTEPSSGQIRIYGRIAPLIALGAGFHPELTGRENIYLNGIIMGMTRREVKHKFDAIVDFAELEEFLDTPVKRYSSGMYARLGFATAIHVDPDILLVDEVLAVGDFAFQQKCLARIEAFKQQGVTVVFVSHNLDMVRKVCDRVILLEHGRISAEGNISEVTGHYFRAIANLRIEKKVDGQRYAQIKDIKLLDSNQINRTDFKSGELIYLRYMVFVYQDIESMEVGLAVERSDGLEIVSVPGSKVGGAVFKPRSGSVYEVMFRMRLNLLGGTYSIGAWVTNEGFARVFDWDNNPIIITVADDYAHGGVTDLNPVCSMTELDG